MAKSKGVEFKTTDGITLRVDFFQAKGNERPIVCTAPLIFARRVGGIDSIAEGHWTIEFRGSIFARLQRNSEDDDIPQIGR
jgi:hypothetical protein